MKKAITLLVFLIIVFSSVTSVSAAGQVNYSGSSKDFIFAPGSEHSPTDLFSDFKDVMPGDSITQKITVKNDASKEVKVKLYMRSLGAHKKSKDFLSQLHLRVQKSDDNKMPYMFDAAANEKAQLSDWVCLGTLYSGGEVNLDVTLDVPVELENKYSNQIGFLDWEFIAEEFPVEEGDPQTPQTGDNSNLTLWLIVLLVSLIIVIGILIYNKKRQK